ncbi:MAG: hypothetical protein ACREJ0_29065, partial [Geminicoccaceae bacterium]
YGLSQAALAYDYRNAASAVLHDCHVCNRNVIDKVCIVVVELKEWSMVCSRVSPESLCPKCNAALQ